MDFIKITSWSFVKKFPCSFEDSIVPTKLDIQMAEKFREARSNISIFAVTQTLSLGYY